MARAEKRMAEAAAIDPPYKPRKKRQQVKNACVNCQKACKKCDEGRPCSRCIKYGLTDTCVDSPRKAQEEGSEERPIQAQKGFGKGMENKAGRQTGAVMVDAKTTPFTQAQVNMEPSQASGLAPAPYFTRPSAFSPVPSKPASQQASLQALMNPQNQELQRPQARRFSVQLPLLSKVDVMPRASSVDRNYHSDYHHELRQNQSTREGNTRELTIKLPKLPSITTITARVNQPPTPIAQLPPLTNILPASGVHMDKPSENVMADAVGRRRSISPSESENSLPASPVDLGWQFQHNETMQDRFSPIRSCTSSAMNGGFNKMGLDFFIDQSPFTNRV